MRTTSLWQHRMQSCRVNWETSLVSSMLKLWMFIICTSHFIFAVLRMSIANAYSHVYHDTTPVCKWYVHYYWYLCVTISTQNHPMKRFPCAHLSSMDRYRCLHKGGYVKLTCCAAVCRESLEWTSWFQLLCVCTDRLRVHAIALFRLCMQFQLSRQDDYT